jgi:STE24 endopeptidase
MWLIYALLVITFVLETWLDAINFKHMDAPIPDNVKDIYEEDTYQTWRQYTKENHRFDLIMKSVDFVILVAFLAFGVFHVFDAWATVLTDRDALFHPFFFLGFYFLVSFVVGTFAGYYRTFRIEETYGFNTTTKRTFVFDRIKAFLLTVVLGGGIILLLHALHRSVSAGFFYVAWGALAVIFILVNLLYVPVFVPLFNKLTPLEDEDLREKIESFAERAGYEISAISVMDASKRSTKLNAFFSGFGRYKRVVLYDTLLEKMDDEHIVAVLAHEIGHNKHRHILYNTCIGLLTLSVYLGILILLLDNPVFSEAFGFESMHVGFSLVLFMILLGPVSFILNIVTSWISRMFEYQADRFSVRQTENKEAMVEALKILSRENFSNLTPHPLYVSMKYSHPPVSERIRAIRETAVS